MLVHREIHTGLWKFTPDIFYICSPYYQQLYINRAYAYMHLKNYRYAFY
jgi:hypothetical protein